MKKYKMYFEKEDFKLYVKGFIIGGDPFVEITLAENESDARIFEEDKANGYIRLVNDERLKMKEVINHE